MTKFVLDKYALDSKKSEAKAKIVGSLGSNASISGDQIEVPSYDASKVVQILSQVGKYLSKINYTYLTTSCLLPFAFCLSSLGN
ncbi:hypothetical protein NIES3806_14420 [Microcystis aeruginosa NIES-3806]|nr:hypothetical protein NIES3806_14420 [Microcystis aeruginosa NIES-3806]